MRRRDQWVASIVLSGVMVVPIGALAMPAPQDDREHQRHEPIGPWLRFLFHPAGGQRSEGRIVSTSNILVVDDEPQIRRFLKVALTAHGFEMIEAAQGADGRRNGALERYLPGLCPRRLRPGETPGNAC